MKEIKFRAWDKLNKKFLDPIIWAKDFHIHLQMGISLNSKLAEKEGVDVHQIILQQFTGLKDKNGKEIYEGDIVSNSEEEKGEIIFDKGVFAILFPNEKLGIGGENSLANFKLEFYEIIGNVWDNPDLLK